MGKKGKKGGKVKRVGEERQVTYIDLRGGGGHKVAVPKGFFVEMLRKKRLFCMHERFYKFACTGDFQEEGEEKEKEKKFLNSLDQSYWSPEWGDVEDFAIEGIVYVEEVDKMSPGWKEKYVQPWQSELIAEEESLKVGAMLVEAEEKEIQKEKEKKKGKRKAEESSEMQKPVDTKEVSEGAGEVKGREGEEREKRGRREGEHSQGEGEQSLIEGEGTKEGGDRGWHMVVGGKTPSMDQMLYRIYMEVQDLKTLKSDMGEVKDDLKKMKRNLDDLHKSVSMTYERTCRANFAFFYERINGDRIIHPITAKILPYGNVQNSIEQLAGLCSKITQLNPFPHTRFTPTNVEIDLFIKIRRKDSLPYTSPESSPMKKTNPSKTELAFTHLMIGEVTRTDELCSDASSYVHPVEVSCNSSSKLLYKLVQVERGINAALHYYAAPAELIQGAIIISPSFRYLSEPEDLLDAVLAHCAHGLQHINRLRQNRQVHLLDI